MKRNLEQKFQLFMREPVRVLSKEMQETLSEEYAEGKGYEVSQMPMQVHDILIEHGVIEDPAILGSGSECAWVSKKDWVYICEIEIEQKELDDYVYCKLWIGGIDLFADIYWNGEIVASGNDFYLPVTADIGGKCREKNTLMIHVHSIDKYIEELEVPEYYKDRTVQKREFFRGYHKDFDDYLGFSPCLTKVGIYDVTFLEYGKQGIQRFDLNVSYEQEKKEGYIQLGISCYRETDEAEETILTASLMNNGKSVKEWSFRVQDILEEVLTIKEPKLWNVVHKGEPCLYDFSIYLQVNGCEVDRITRHIGFRTIERVGDFEFRINGMSLKLWGANFAPLDNKTCCYQADRAKETIRLVLNANMNCIRVWGGGIRLPEEFYTMCDEAGILIWQDFFHDFSFYLEDEESHSLYRQEAEFQVRRLRSHPSILLWCGSNETLMQADFNELPSDAKYGYSIFDEDYRNICATLDKERYYHISSPSGGAYANDPLEGDTHSYTSTWFVPGGQYPVFLSENMRSFLPVYHSMLKMVGEENIWPEGETGQMYKNQIFPWPSAWRKYTSYDSWRKISPVEQFYDANDVESMIYRFGGSVGRYIEDCVGRYRRGRSYEERMEDYRRCKGHLWWKLNTSGPHIYSGLIDYYLETYIPYYAMKRCYQPFQLFFSVDDFIGLWAVNDTIEEKKGTITIALFNIRTNQIYKSFEQEFSAKPDQSVFIADLNRFGQFVMNEIVLYAKAVDENGQILTEVIDYADIERHIVFPDCRLKLSVEGDKLTVETDCFARNIELVGNEDGDKFGWKFDDNYFDLLPGMQKQVRILGEHKKGIITAKGFYAIKGTQIEYKRD